MEDSKMSTLFISIAIVVVSIIVEALIGSNYTTKGLTLLLLSHLLINSGKDKRFK